MTQSPKEYVSALAKSAAALQLARAATFAKLYAAKPLFQRTMKQPGGASVVVRLDWPGVLRVFDPATGVLMAESSPGYPAQLAQTRLQATDDPGGAV